MLCKKAFTKLKCLTGVRKCISGSFTTGSHDLIAFTDPSHERTGKHDTQDLKKTQMKRRNMRRG